MLRVLSLCLLAATSLTTLAQPLSVEEFFKRPDYSHMDLSPDGKRAAAIVRGAPHDSLAVIDLDKRAVRQVARFEDADILVFHWTNNQRLLLGVGEAYLATGERRFYGWWAVNADGSDLHAINTQENPGGTGTRLRNLAENFSATWGFEYLGPDPDGGDNIVITARKRRGLLDVYRYNTRTGEMTLLSDDRPARNITVWRTDRNAVPRLAVSYDEDTGITTMWYRDAAGPLWTKLDEGKDSELKVFPIAFDYDNRTLYVGANTADKMAIYRYDFEKRRPGERIARHLDVDMGTITFSRTQRKVLGFPYNADKPGYIWLDEHVARIQQTVNGALPNSVNEVHVADENPVRAMIVTHSDVAPQEFYLLDMEKKSLVKFASSRPWIKPREMSERKFVRYKARDGMEIPAYLTLPRQSSGKNLPLVVEIHGGPWVGKQRWGFNADAQFLASRGYAVLQPDFRGTRGYGWRHYSASFGEWGLSMQDDITDGVEWLIREGIVAKDRICLMGASYGGYAALWGLMKTPDLYRCGIAAFPVTAIEQLFDFNVNARFRSAWYQLGGKIRVGDPEKDRDKFRKVSPLYQTDLLKAPILLVYGGADEVTPVKYGNAFRSALERSGKKYEWVVYPKEAHGLNVDENRFDFYRRVETFLKLHLAPSDPAKLQ